MMNRNPMLQDQNVTPYKQYTENRMMKERQALTHQLSVKVPKICGLELMQGPPQPFDWN